MLAIIVNSIEVIAACTVCYVLGNRRAIKYLEARNNQATDANFGEPVLDQGDCTCGHKSNYHAVSLDGRKFLECEVDTSHAYPGSRKMVCACNRYTPRRNRNA